MPRGPGRLFRPTILLFASPRNRLLNEVQYTIAGIRRSGIHAVSDWIFAQFRGPAMMLNDVLPGKDPRKNFSGNTVARGGVAAQDESKDCLLVIYEDRPLSTVAQSEVQHFLGASRATHCLVVLRDPFNLLASRLRWQRKPGAAPELMDALRGRDLWIDYSREYLGDRPADWPGALWINYNRWVYDPQYRTEVGQSLGLPEPARPSRGVSPFGGGSSFDGMGYDGRADQMQLLQRWREFIDEPGYLKLLAHSELLGASARIFGVEPFLPIYERLRVLP